MVVLFSAPCIYREDFKFFWKDFCGGDSRPLSLRSNESECIPRLEGRAEDVEEVGFFTVKGSRGVHVLGLADCLPGRPDGSIDSLCV